MKRTNELKTGFALIYNMSNGQKLVTAKLPSARTAYHQGRLAVQNKHRSGVESFETCMYRCDRRKETQQILKARGVANWEQF